MCDEHTWRGTRQVFKNFSNIRRKGECKMTTKELQEILDKHKKDRWNECSEGIHFFINRQEAVEY